MSAPPAFKRGQRVRLLAQVQGIPAGVPAEVFIVKSPARARKRVLRYLVRHGRHIALVDEFYLEPIESESADGKR